MGGTLIRLVEQGHEVHVAYMTSGNIAVFDHDARRFADFVAEFNRLFGIDREHDRRASKTRVHAVPRHARSRASPTREDVLQDQGADPLRREARAAALACGMPPEQLQFLDLPFLPHRHDRQDADPPARTSRIIATLLERLQPAQIYVAGEMSDPHGTHRICAEAIFEAVRRVASRGAATSRCWLYRGAWEEWEPHEIETRRAAQPGRPGAQEAGDLPARVAEGPGPVPRRHRPRASSGSGPRTATATRRRSTTSWACRSSTRWKGSCSGVIESPMATAFPTRPPLRVTPHPPSPLAVPLLACANRSFRLRKYIRYSSRRSSSDSSQIDG